MILNIVLLLVGLALIVFGADWLADAYREEPTESRRRVYARLRELCPEATEKQLRKLLGD